MIDTDGGERLNGPEQDVGLVLSGFDWEDEEMPAELLGDGSRQQVAPDEIVIECPVVIEFVGRGLSLEARDEVVLAVMDQIASAVSRT